MTRLEITIVLALWVLVGLAALAARLSAREDADR